MTKLFSVGHSVPRLESVEKVTGKLQYLSDLKLPGMLHGKILRSSAAHARIVHIDSSRAEQLPGVVCVLTRSDVLASSRYASHYGPVFKDQTVVALDKVRYIGDPVAAVAAVTPLIAEEALELIDVDYDPLPAAFTAQDALAPNAGVLHESVARPEHGFADMKDVAPVAGTNICSQFSLLKGNPAAGFAAADHVFEDAFSSPAVQHATLESFTTAAQFDSTGRLTIWSTVQNPFVIREQIAELFRLPLSMVRVIALHLGGGYGAKLYPKLEPLVAALAYKAQQPVSVTLTREEVFHTITKHAADITVKTGVMNDGTIVARECRIALNTGAYAEIGPRVCKKSGYTAAGPYAIPNVSIESRLIYTNCVPAGAFRGFGTTQTAWAHESQMGMIARRLNLDPLEFMLKNLLDDGAEFVTGERVHSFGLKECLTRSAAAIAWGQKRTPRDPTKAIGKGLATLVKATITPSTSSALVRLNEDGSAHVYVGTVEIGQGSDTTMAQIASEVLGIPLGRIAVVHSDTDLVPYDLTTSSSRSTFHMGRAVQIASEEIKNELALAAAVLFGVAPEHVSFGEQSVWPGSDRTKRLSYTDLLLKHFGMSGANFVGRGSFRTSGADANGDKLTSEFWFVGAGAAEVEVDRETGMVRLLRYATAVDAGKAVNPKHCEQQIRGAAISGIGQAFLEEMVYQDGLLINPNFFDYNLPRFLDMPEELTAIIVERPHPEGPFGAKGIGETAIIPVAPAIANAIEDAVGVRITQLPITPERVLNALRATEQAVSPQTTGAL